MTFNQFSNLSKEKRESLFKKTLIIDRKLDDKKNKIFDSTFRLVSDEDGIANYVRPYCSKANREYDYAHSEYSFIFELGFKMYNYNLEREDK